MAFYTLKWKAPSGQSCSVRFDSADELANKLLGIVKEYNEEDISHGGNGGFGVMDFEGIFYVFEHDKGIRRLLLEDVPSCCSSEWFLKRHKEETKRKVEVILDSISIAPVDLGTSDVLGYRPINRSGYQWWVDEPEYGNKLYLSYVSYIHNREGNRRIKEELDKNGYTVYYALGLPDVGVMILLNS